MVCQYTSSFEKTPFINCSETFYFDVQSTFDVMSIVRFILMEKTLYSNREKVLISVVNGQNIWYKEVIEDPLFSEILQIHKLQFEVFYINLDIYNDYIIRNKWILLSMCILCSKSYSYNIKQLVVGLAVAMLFSRCGQATTKETAYKLKQLPNLMHA